MTSLPRPASAVFAFTASATLRLATALGLAALLAGCAARAELTHTGPQATPAIAAYQMCAQRVLRGLTRNPDSARDAAAAAENLCTLERTAVADAVTVDNGGDLRAQSYSAAFVREMRKDTINRLAAELVNK